MNSNDVSYVIGQFMGAAVIVVVFVWLIVWAIRKPKAAGAQATPASPLFFGLTPGEGMGAVWPAAHPSGAPMVITTTTSGVLAMNYTEDATLPIRVPHHGLTIKPGRVLAPAHGSLQPRLELEILSSHYAPFLVIVEQPVATQISTWANPA